MAKISDHQFTDDEVGGLIAQGHGYAQYALIHNKQFHYENYEKLACALEQMKAQRDDARAQALNSVEEG